MEYQREYLETVRIIKPEDCYWGVIRLIKDLRAHIKIIQRITIIG